MSNSPQQAHAVSGTVIRSAKVFKGLSDDAVDRLGAAATIKYLKRHTTVFYDGDKSQSVFIIMAGRMHVLNSETDGKEFIISQMGPGELFGEMGLIDGSLRSATVVAAEPSTLVEISSQAFLACLEQNPDVAVAVTKSVAERLRKATTTVKNLALGNVEQRIRVLLENISIADGPSRRVPYKITQSDIAKMVGASREMVTRIMGQLVEAGAIAHDQQGMLLLLDLPPPGKR